MKAAERAIALERFRDFVDAMGDLRNGAICLYVQTALYILCGDDPIVPVEDVQYISDQSEEDFAAELVAAGLWERVHDDSGEVVGYRILAP